MVTSCKPPFLSHPGLGTAGPWGVLVCKAGASTHVTVLDWSWRKEKEENGQTEFHPAKKQKAMPAIHQSQNSSYSVWESHLTFWASISSALKGASWAGGGGQVEGNMAKFQSSMDFNPCLAPIVTLMGLRPNCFLPQDISSLCWGSWSKVTPPRLTNHLSDDGDDDNNSVYSCPHHQKSHFKCTGQREHLRSPTALHYQH